MAKILDRLELAANTNPAEALKLLPELFRAVREGHIRELPVIGDTVYFTGYGGIREWTVYEIEIVKGYTTIRLGHIGTDDYQSFDLSEVGDRWHLTREAAEKRLESENHA